MKTRSVFMLMVCLFCLPAATAPWKEILLAPPAQLPAAVSFTVTWRTNLAKAMAEAKKENRPLFVTLRCLPCKQCSAFDKEVLEGGPELDPILTQFITVRLTDAAELDLRFLPVEGFQDLDLSLWGWFLAPEGRVYGVYGGRDHVSDATRISKASLMAALQRVLAHHYNPRRSQWNVDGPAPQLSGNAKSPRQLPGYDGWLREAPSEVKKQACLHCHEINDILRQPAVAAKTFNKQRDFEVWPLPENVGITLDRDHGLLVKNVAPGSAAERAGLKAGDVLGAADERRLFGQTDFRGVLHRGPRDAGQIEVWWLREREVMPGTLLVPDGWRKTVLDWRMSVSQGIVGAYPGFFPLAANAKRCQQLDLATNQMAVEPFMGPKPKGAPFNAGLRGGHIVTGVNGESPNLSGRAFLVWFIQRFDPGDRVTLSVMDKPGSTREVSYQLPPRGE